MKARPTIFLSGVSHEFDGFRGAVENQIKKKGCYAENQPGFAPDYRTVEEMLRRKLHDADAMIHIVGFRFGAEPNQRPENVPRRSYTQMEFYLAREMLKPVYVFLSTDPSVRDEPMPKEKPEESDIAALQVAHRKAVQNTNHLYYFFKDKAELCKLVAEIPPVQAAGFQSDISRIVKYAPAELIGREAETQLLNDAWMKVRRAEIPRPHILTFVALGGEGKTSLVAKWAAELAHQGWPGCDAAFAWSFYSQGTREQTAVSSDLFLAEALTFFGDAAMAASAFDKGRRLAQLVGEQRALLILDGLEPLQYAPTSPTPGELKDAGLIALLIGLAAASLGLCVVTTRYTIPNLRAYWQTTAPEMELTRLSTEAGVALLKNLGVKTGAKEDFEKLVEDVDGHALTLQIMGGFLKKAFRGDIRCRDRVKFEKADAKVQGGHAFRAMAAYVKWMEDQSDEARRELAILRLMGLFDRPATADCVSALLKSPAITGLNEPLVELPEEDWNSSLDALETAKLLTINRDAAGTLISLDAHPLLREYFAKHLRENNPVAWRAAHQRLFEHLCATTQEGDRPTLEALQPLYQAVAHGCQAGLQQEACAKVYFDRILRGQEAYSTKKLGAIGSDLGAVACFFATPWSRVSSALTAAYQAWLLMNEAAFRLRALGRLSEALEPMRAGIEGAVRLEDWKNAAIYAGNLSELELTLGEVAGAVADAEQSVTYADRSGDAFMREVNRTVSADALHQAGRRTEAEARFREVEQMQAERQPAYPLLYSLRGFQYCDLLLTEAEREAGKANQRPEVRRQRTELVEVCRAVSERAAQTLDWWTNHFTNAPLLTIALDHLTLGRAALFRAILEQAGFRLPAPDFSYIDQAVDGLRRAGTQDHLPRQGSGMFIKNNLS
jgi:hypothetical protein